MGSEAVLALLVTLIREAVAAGFNGGQGAGRPAPCP